MEQGVGKEARFSGDLLGSDVGGRRAVGVCTGGLKTRVAEQKKTEGPFGQVQHPRQSPSTVIN